MSKQVQELVIIIEPHIIDKNNNNLSLADLGYTGITDQTITLNKSSILKNIDKQPAPQKKAEKKEEDGI